MTANQVQATPAAGDPAGASLPLSSTERTRHRRLWHLGAGPTGSRCTGCCALFAPLGLPPYPPDTATNPDS
jgi:hypothetical protein